MQPLRSMIALGYLLLVAGTAAWAVVGGNRPYAPFSILPQPDPITLTVVYGTEKETWLQEATAAFEASGANLRGAPINVELRGIGSGEALQGLSSGTLQADVWSPASSLWIELLDNDAQQPNGRQLITSSGADAPRSLVLTPLVLVAWQQRAAALSNSDQTVWQNLHTAIVAPEGWAAKGRPEWGFVKWGHTRPTTSNSGLQTLLLLAYAYHNKSSGLTVADVQNPEFILWLSETEKAATFGDSSGTFIDDLVLYGPSKYDLVATYENLALEQITNARNRWNDSLVLIYPPANIWSDHPYAIVDAEWVTPAEREAARVFRDFLLSRKQQEQALRLGFRPALQDVALDSPNSPFTRNNTAGVQFDVPQLVEVPDAAVVNALLETWTRTVQR